MAVDINWKTFLSPASSLPSCRLSCERRRWGRSSQIPSGGVERSLQQAVLWRTQERWWGLRTPLKRPLTQWLTTCTELLDVFYTNLCRYYIKSSMFKHIKVFYLTQIILKTDFAHMFSYWWRKTQGDNVVKTSRDGFPRKNCCSFVQMRWGRALPKFFFTFS